MGLDGIRGRLLGLMGKDGYVPLNKSELARELELGTDERAEMRSELAMLEREGQIVYLRQGRYELAGKPKPAPDKRSAGGNKKDRAAKPAAEKPKRKAPSADAPVLTGLLRLHPRGFAWFYPDLGDPANLQSGVTFNSYTRFEVPAKYTGVALDGDRVEVVMEHSPPTGRSSAAPDTGAADWTGRVRKVLSRRRGNIVGIYQAHGDDRWVVPDEATMPARVEITGETTARHGQKVVVELESWEKPSDVPVGSVIEVLGWPGDPGVDIEAVIHRHGLATSFPEEVRRETSAVPDTVQPADLTDRIDWRQRMVITIDPDDAKDFDDAICVTPNERGWELAVHIADVSHYVKPASALDEEARQRGNSTYLVDRVLPMLPPELSNGICSLRPKVDRLTKLAVIQLDKTAKVVDAKFYNAVIHSQARLTYADAQTMIVGEGSGPVAEAVREAWKLATLIRRRRFDQGALDMDMAETRVKLDDKGKPVGISIEEYNESHQLIEEFMLLANEAVARALKGAQKPAIFRVHDDPDSAKLIEYAEVARQHGYAPGDLTNRMHIQKLLDEAKGRPEEHAIKIGLLKSLKRAAYDPDPLGHYGLAKGDYCHFTSPIRRYADLIVHRALQALLVNRPARPDSTPPHSEMTKIAAHISATERTSAEAENETRRLKMLEYLATSAQSADPPKFMAVVTDVRPMGLQIEALAIQTRGLVKREHFPKGDWYFEPSLGRYSASGGQQLRLGQVLEVTIGKIDFERQFVDFRISSIPEPKPGDRASKRSENPHAPAAKRSRSRSGDDGQQRRSRGGSGERSQGRGRTSTDAKPANRRGKSSTEAKPPATEGAKRRRRR
jgi:ribonuclease R